jgi:hypothetical protein
MTKSMTVEQVAGLRALSQDEIAAVTGGAVSYTTTGGLGCFPIFEDDGKGNIIIISPTLGRLPWTFPR